jgi:hypothetical protein
MERSQTQTQNEAPVSRLPLWWVLIVNGLVIANSIPFFFLPRGTGVRPMGSGMFLFMLVFAGFAGIILGMRRCYERMPYQWAVILLGFTPLPLGALLFLIARLICGFVVEP